MLTQIDHVVVVVNDLETAAAGYRKAGFTVTAGGEHAGGETHNALVPFKDGTFIELLAFTRPNPDGNHYFSKRHRLGGGLTEFAIASTDIDQDVRTITDRGVAYPIPTHLSRVKPDGTVLEWRMSLPGNVHHGRGFPFLIQDLTDRHLRVPAGEPETTHANGAIGMAGTTVIVSRLEAAAAEYRAIVGAREGSPRSVDVAGKGILRIPLPGPADQWIALMQTFPDSAPAAWHARFGEGPYAIHLRREPGATVIPGDGDLIDPVLVGGARLYL